MSYYVLGSKHSLPAFVVTAIASWALSLTAISIIAAAIWLGGEASHANVMESLPGFAAWPLYVVGAYAGFGSLCLYAAMWVYWIAVDRSSWPIRSAWFIAMLFCLIYGAVVYAFFIWSTQLEKVNGPQPLFDRKLD